MVCLRYVYLRAVGTVRRGGSAGAFKVWERGGRYRRERTKDKGDVYSCLKGKGGNSGKS